MVSVKNSQKSIDFHSYDSETKSILTNKLTWKILKNNLILRENIQNYKSPSKVSRFRRAKLTWKYIKSQSIFRVTIQSKKIFKKSIFTEKYCLKFSKITWEKLTSNYSKSQIIFTVTIQSKISGKWVDSSLKIFWLNFDEKS